MDDTKPEKADKSEMDARKVNEGDVVAARCCDADGLWLFMDSQVFINFPFQLVSSHDELRDLLGTRIEASQPDTMAGTNTAFPAQLDRSTTAPPPEFERFEDFMTPQMRVNAIAEVVSGIATRIARRTDERSDTVEEP
jgi:hypothetical protein